MSCRSSFQRNEIGNWSYREISAEIVFFLGDWHLINDGDFFGIRKFSFRCKHIVDVIYFSYSEFALVYIDAQTYFFQSVKDDFHVPVLIFHIGNINENVIHDYFAWCVFGQHFNGSLIQLDPDFISYDIRR